jgi:hypothetical protein
MRTLSLAEAGRVAGGDAFGDTLVDTGERGVAYGKQLRSGGTIVHAVVGNAIIGYGHILITAGESWNENYGGEKGGGSGGGSGGGGNGPGGPRPPPNGPAPPPSGGTCSLGHTSWDGQTLTYHPGNCSGR